MRRPSLLAPLALLAALVAAVPAHAAQAPHVGPVARVDAHEFPTSGLDLDRVAFGQLDTRLVLRIRTTKPWPATQLTAAGRRRLCLELEPAAGAARTLCVASDRGRAVLLAPDGAGIAAKVERTDQRRLTATFTPLAAGLPPGPLRWRVQADWVGAGRCAAGCTDLAPDPAPGQLGLGVLGGRAPCFGAASRDPLTPCRNGALRSVVVPTPLDALLAPNADCELLDRDKLISPCAFGALPAQASSTVALLGDSHAAHWRGALEVVTQARAWRGISLTLAGCPLTRGRPILPTKARSRQCLAFNRGVRAWIAAHPEVHTVFLSAHTTARAEGDVRAGYAAALRGLPSSVKRIFVLRDPPQDRSPRQDCIDQASAAGKAVGVACAQPRRVDLRPDPFFATARDLGDPRITVIDLSSYMCGPRQCLPVVGGALVHKDGSHLTSVFSTTLGPYVLRAVTAAGA